MLQAIFFFFFAAVAVAAALSMILQKNPVYSALSLIVVIASMGGLFLLLNAAFLAALQLVIYAGAIMTLFLFVLMMVDVQAEAPSRMTLESKLALLILLLIAGAAIWTVSQSLLPGFQASSAGLNVKALSRELFSSYILPFEGISVLIISSVIGSLYIARKEEA